MRIVLARSLAEADELIASRRRTIRDLSGMPGYPSRIEVGGRSAATAATAGHVAMQVWNASATRRIEIEELHCAITTAGVANLALRRTTVRGTPGSTVTPDSDNSYQRDAAPPSGFVLDLAAFTVQPTVDASDIRRWNLPGAIGAGIIWVFSVPLIIPPGTGLAIATPTAVVFPASDFTAVVDD